MTAVTSTDTGVGRDAARVGGSPVRRLAVTAVGATVLNVALAQALRAATGTSSDFLPMQPGPVAVATLLGVGAGGALYVVLRRFVRRPVPVLVGRRPRTGRTGAATASPHATIDRRSSR